MLRSMIKPIISSLIKQAVSTSYCDYRWCRRVLCERHITSKTSMSSDMSIRQKNKDFMELEPEEANKSLYICNLERLIDRSRAYVISKVKLSDLLLSSLPVVPLQHVCGYTRPLLPLYGGCGLLGSQVFFHGGVTPLCPTRSYWKRDVYVFDTQTNDPNESIRKLQAKLQGGKHTSRTTELCGKLYVLSYEKVDNSPSFEVYDPKLGTWEALPHPPFFKTGSYCDDSYHHLSYAVANTKIFASNDRGPVFCFDAAHLDKKEWRMVSTISKGGPFPFRGVALVLDIDGEDDKKIVFAYSINLWRLQVFLMSLRDNQETIKKIGDAEIPEFPEELGVPSLCKLLHIGGKKACIAVTIIVPSDKSVRIPYGVVIPFQYELDMAKDKKNRLSIQFMDIRYYEYPTNGSFFFIVDTAGCFLL